MRILLFDWYSGGHHGLYIDAFAQVLARRHEVVVAAPAASLETVRNDEVEHLVLPAANGEGRVAKQRELELFRDCARATRAHRAVHLFADALLTGLISHGFPTGVSVMLFRPRAHWRDLGGIDPGVRERAVGVAYAAAVAAWRRTPNACSLLTLDEVAARRWSHGRGAPAIWVPEPPVRAAPPPSGRERAGAVLFGALAERKGIGYVAHALETGATGIKLTIAGSVNTDFEQPLAGYRTALERAGVDVSVHGRRHEEDEAIRLLARHRVALLPYVGHVGMSRVLLEAATAATPVIAHDQGLLGHLVREHGLGLAVDCRNPVALGEAIRRFTNDGRFARDFAPALAAFAARYDDERFTSSVERAIAAGE